MPMRDFFFGDDDKARLVMNLQITSQYFISTAPKKKGERITCLLDFAKTSFPYLIIRTRKKKDALLNCH